MTHSGSEPLRPPRGRYGRLVDLTVVGAITVLVLGAGGWAPQVLLLACALILAASILSAVTASQSRSRSHYFELICAALAGYCVVQVLPLPPSVVAVLNPRVLDLVEHSDSSWVSLAYERGAGLREAGKYGLYGATFYLVRQRSKAGSTTFYLNALLWLGATSATIGLLHRMLGMKQMFGLFGLGGSSSEIFSTFVNPNHSAGFFAFLLFVLMGLGLETGQRRKQVAFFACAAVCGVLVALTESRGAIGAMALGCGLFAGVLWRKRGVRNVEMSRILMSSMVVLGATAGGFLWVLARRQAGYLGQLLNVDEKRAGLADVFQLIQDHPVVGVGRGSYVSVYPHYKSSALQVMFTFPENIVAQWTSEWGILIGGLALAALATWCAWLLVRVRRVALVGALTGVVAVLFQNLVDFSLELPGMSAVCVVVLALASGRRRLSVRRASSGTKVRSRSGRLQSIAYAAASLCLVLLGFRTGDVLWDLAGLMESQPTREQALVLSQVHPANPLFPVAIASSYLVEEPRSAPKALHWCNRALMLAPTYSEAHRLTALALLETGHRRQAFEVFRTAWSLAGGRAGGVALEVVRRAKNPREVTDAIPRADDTIDSLDVNAVLFVIPKLLAAGRSSWVETVVGQLEPRRLDETQLARVLSAATNFGGRDLSMRLVAEARGREVPSPSLTVACVAALVKAGEGEQARAMLAGAVDDPKDLDANSMLKLGELALGLGDLRAAELLFANLERAGGLSREQRLHLVRQRAELSADSGKPAEALERLNQSISQNPTELSLRLDRAKILINIGRLDRAREDVEFVTRRAPDDRRARTLLRRVERLQVE